MYNIQVEGVERTMRNLNLKAQQIHSELSYIILGVGDEVVRKLQIAFKDLTISGQFFPRNLEYWIGISRIGKTVTWIKCPNTNLFFSKDRKIDGSQDIKSSVPVVDIVKISSEITQELIIKINEMLKIILK